MFENIFACKFCNAFDNKTVCVLVLNKQQRIPKGQSKVDNPDTLVTKRRKTKEKKNTTQ